MPLTSHGTRATELGEPGAPTVTLRSAREGDTVALTELWATAFSPALSPEQWLLDADRCAHTVVAEDASGVLGSIYGIRKQLRETEASTALVHCIGSVAVDSRARGQGLARRLVAASLVQARAAGADWALLFTGTPEVYRSSGFARFAMLRTVAGRWRPTAVAPGDRDLCVERSTVAAGTFGALNDVYARARDGRVTLAPVRSEVDLAMADVRLHGARVYRHMAAGTLAGYVIAEVRGGVGVISEIAVDPRRSDQAAVAAALLQAVGEDWSAAGVDSCDIAAPALGAEWAAIVAFAPDAVSEVDLTGMTAQLTRSARLGESAHFGAADYF